MAGYRLQSIADLARQLGFAPNHTRAAQIDAAESLLLELDPRKAYPLSFVVFRITAYHPKTSPTVTTENGEELFTGLALQHDLGRLIEQTSDSLSTPTTAFPEPVLTIDDLTEKFNVTSKTIQRWRRKGLPARRFVFPDGKRRVGFLVRSVERFVAIHADEISQATNFSQVSNPEHEEIVRRARRLALSCQCCMTEISRRIARKMRRSPLTILHTLRKHDTDHPDLAIFPLTTAPVPADEQVRLARHYRKGIALKVLARRACRSRSVVYRAIVEERLARLNRRKHKFIDDPLYHGNDAATTIDQIATAAQGSAALAAPRPSSSTDERTPKDLPAYFQSLYRTPLLTPARERALFLKFNFHKFQFVTARRRLDPAYVKARDVARLESFLKLATDTKNAIVSANLRLVVSVARKHLRPDIDLMELVSEGNITLMRAIESFDFHKGNKFSTYATLALMKGFARTVPAMQVARRKSGQREELLALAPDRSASTESRLADHEHLRSLLTHLTPPERAALLHAYQIDPASKSLKGLAPTPAELASTTTLSRHRQKQLESSALEKLRTAAGLPASD